MTVEAINRFTGPYYFLSNFYPHPVTFEGQVYPTSEHAYQAAKTLDEVERTQIRMRLDPREAKAMGRFVKMRPGWDSRRLDYMRIVLRSKFSDPTLAEMLVSTGAAQLIEGNTWGDVYWGVCRGRGKNMLGQLLMEVRSEIAARRSGGA